MTDEREKHIKATDEGQDPDVEAHKHLKGNAEPTGPDEAETPDVEGHAHVKAKVK